jgi:hypothetical protein
MRWARNSLCALAASVVLLVATVPTPAGVRAGADTAGTATAGPALSLAAQTAWVSPAAPWFALTAAASSGTGAIGDLHVELTFYDRINNETELGQAINAVPNKRVVAHFNFPLTATPDGNVAATCVTVLPEASITPPTVAPPNTVACPAGSNTVILGCTPDVGTCGDVYPVSVALYRQGTDAPLGRFTTFLTYQEPGLSASGGVPLRVGIVVPISAHLTPTHQSPSGAALEPAEDLMGVLAEHRGVAVSIAANPVTVTALQAVGRKKGHRAVAQLRNLTTAPAGGDELLAQPYVPIDLVSLAHADLTSEIGAQLARGTALLDAVGLHPTPGTWVDTSSDLSSADVSDLADGLEAAHANRMILDDADLAPLPTGPTVPKSLANLTFAQPFTLAVGGGRHTTAAGADSEVDALFTADPNDPILAANQIIARLEFIHFENASELDARGVVVEPPESWQPSDPLLTTLLAEMAGNPVLSPVTLDQFFTQVPQGGNQEPTSRRLQTGSPPKSGVFAAGTVRHLATARANLSSFTRAVVGHPAVLVELSDLLLATENRSFDPAQRAEALAIFIQRFGVEVNLVSLAAQNTITFTSRTAPIPVSVLSSATFHINVVLSLSSDKFAFPDGSSRALVLDHPTTPVRIQARSVTSGDRLPVEVTLTTPDGQLVIARAALTVHSTSISIVGIALTVLAALVLLVWWARTWRKGRKKRPRAA